MRGGELYILIGVLAVTGCATAETPGARSDDVDASPDSDAPPPDAATPDAPVPVDIVLGQTNSTEITPQNSLACLNPTRTAHSENSYYRVFDLAAEGVDRELFVEKVSVGIENADSENGNTQPMDVKLHTLVGNFTTVANLTQIAMAPVAVADQTGTILEVNFQTTVPASSQLVVEVFTPDGDPNGDNVGSRFFVGSNDQGETAPTYFRAPGCDFAEPVESPAIDPDLNMHMVLTVAGVF